MKGQVLASPLLCWQHVEKWARTRPRSECLVYKDRRVTWREFGERVDAAARAMLEAGVEKGDRVALLAMGCLEFPITFMAAAKIGAIWLGLSPKYTRRELLTILRDAEPAILISLCRYGERDLIEDALALQREVPSIRKLLVAGPPFDGADSFDGWANTPRPHLDDALARRAAEIGIDDDLLLMYTSGSTGVPKGVLHTHRSTMSSVEVQNRHFRVSESSRVLIQFPINHVAADVELGLSALRAGATMVIEDRFDPAESLRLVERERVTVLGGVPAMFLKQFATPEFNEVDLGSVETFICAGSPAPRQAIETLARIAAHTGARLLTGYGSTEAGGFVTYSRPDDDLDTLARAAGCVLPDTDLRIVDEDRRLLGLGEPGEIALRGPTLMRGYWNKPEATREVMDDDGWYYTGDIGWLDERGCVYIVGRTSEMFKTGGENVFPREVEEVLEWHPAVAGAAVVGVPDETYHEVGVAFVVFRPGVLASEDELRSHCRNHLANFKVPKFIERRPSLPVLGTGKVNKRALREEVLERFRT